MGGLDRALAIAVEAHTGQTDKAGEPYILHVLRVVLSVSSGDAQIVAALHDVVEDSSWTFPLLAAQGFSVEAVQAVDVLTRRPGEDYRSYIRRVLKNPLAATVKVIDLHDNLSPKRRESLPDSLAKRYESALDQLSVTVESRAARAGL